MEASKRVLIRQPIGFNGWPTHASGAALEEDVEPKRPFERSLRTDEFWTDFLYFDFLLPAVKVRYDRNRELECKGRRQECCIDP